jgi:hypothetical protein
MEAAGWQQGQTVSVRRQQAGAATTHCGQAAGCSPSVGQACCWQGATGCYMLQHKNSLKLPLVNRSPAVFRHA